MVEIGKKTQIVGEPSIDFDFEEFRSMIAYSPTGETHHLSSQFHCGGHQYVFNSRLFMALHTDDNEPIEAHGPLTTRTSAVFLPG